MKTVVYFFTGALMLCSLFSNAQQNAAQLKKDLKNFVHQTDIVFKNQLVTDRAFNFFLQKKSSYYLTGASEVSISKAFATYSSDNDKFNFGVNFRNENEDKKLSWIFTPLLESDIKKNFTTFYKKGEWQSDIRLGAKISVFFGGSVKFRGMNLSDEQETQMIVIRNKELAQILEKINKENSLRPATDETFENLLLKSLEALLQEAEKRKRLNKSDDVATATADTLNKIINPLRIYTNQIDSLQKRLSNINSTPSSGDLDKIKSSLAATLDTIKIKRAKHVDSYLKKIDKTQDEVLDEYKTQIANAEVDALYKKNSYTFFQNFWVSTWGYAPLKERKTFVAADNTKGFQKQKMNLWEYNLQMNGMCEWNNSFSLYSYFGWKVFQNNTALSDLMTAVDYYQYTAFPPTSTTQSNLAVTENNKAFIGEFREFVTNNFNVQIVFSLSNTDASGKERFCTPGISVFGEKNLGDYSAFNLRFGVPLRFRGKSTPINIEPQIRLNDISNYSTKTDYKLQPVIGVNVGLPFAALFK